jgi:hypothetical protein
MNRGHKGKISNAKGPNAKEISRRPNLKVGGALGLSLHFFWRLSIGVWSFRARG